MVLLLEGWMCIQRLYNTQVDYRMGVLRVDDVSKILLDLYRAADFFVQIYLAVLSAALKIILTLTSSFSTSKDRIPSHTLPTKKIYYNQRKEQTFPKSNFPH
jgi:hypothetical protein